MHPAVAIHHARLRIVPHAGGAAFVDVLAEDADLVGRRRPPSSFSSFSIAPMSWRIAFAIALSFSP